MQYFILFIWILFYLLMFVLMDFSIIELKLNIQIKWTSTITRIKLL